jgi:hypothetical protein
LDAALSEQFLDITVGQGVAQVPADREDDHVGREAETGEGGPGGGSRTRAASSHTDSLTARSQSPRMQPCRRFFERAIATTNVAPAEVITDRAATYPVVLDELLPAAWHRTEQYPTTASSATTAG